ncbi:MAG: type III pantothenate kinase [Chloroflexi bacterium]|nr:type III pantothenate kinase [Chloroflexota bacterium]
MAKGDLLVIDIGNTNIVLGIYREVKLLVSWRLSTDAEKMADEYSVLLRDLFSSAGLDTRAIKGCAISCVVPPLLRPFLEVVNKQFGVKPLVVGPGVRTGVRIFTDNPREVGADRITNAVAAAKLHGLPALVIDFGTATTFDVVSKEGDYLGGAIAPGVGIAAESLWRRAAQLPRIELAFPPAAIGKNTIQAMQSGVLLGYVSLVEGMVERISQELGEKPVVIATGGLASMVAEKTKAIQRVEPELTLEGLRLIYEMNQ